MATKETKNFGFSSVGLLEGLQQQESVIHGAFFSRTSGSVSEINLFGVEFVSRGWTNTWRRSAFISRAFSSCPMRNYLRFSPRRKIPRGWWLATGSTNQLSTLFVSSTANGMEMALWCVDVVTTGGGSHNCSNCFSVSFCHLLPCFVRRGMDNTQPTRTVNKNQHCFHQNISHWIRTFSSKMSSNLTTLLFESSNWAGKAAVHFSAHKKVVLYWIKFGSVNPTRTDEAGSEVFGGRLSEMRQFYACNATTMSKRPGSVNQWSEISGHTCVNFLLQSWLRCVTLTKFRCTPEYLLGRVNWTKCWCSHERSEVPCTRTGT